VERNVIVGFLYEVELKDASRSVVFLADISGSSNLEIYGSKGQLSKTEIPIGAQGFFEVARIYVTDRSIPWSLDLRYTWTEREIATKKLSDTIELEITDHWVKGAAVTSMEYRLRSKEKVEFVADFSGSSNLELVTGYLRAACVALNPNDWVNVGRLQVIDPSKPWNILCKYEWSDYIENQPPIDVPERRELAPGVVLVTTRLHQGKKECFRFQIACAKNVIIDISLDCSASSNMAFPEGVSVLTAVVHPWDRVTIGTIAVIDQNQPWKLRYKMTLSERAPRTIAEVSEPDELVLEKQLTELTIGKAGNESDGNRSRNVSCESRRSSSTAEDFSPSAKIGIPELIEEPSVTTKEIARGVFLLVSQHPGRRGVSYQVQVHRDVKVSFYCNFEGSTNLILQDADQPLERQTTIEPFKCKQVANLTAIDPTTPWTLRCQYSWEELELETLEVFLGGLGLSEYSDVFQREAVDMNLLLQLGKNEKSLRSTLQELGVSLIGHRELIVTSILEKTRLQAT